MARKSIGGGRQKIIDKNVEIYGKYINDLKVSPFESLNMFHLRSQLERTELTAELKLKLTKYDLQLIENAKEMVAHITQIYDFSRSDEPISEWWWHLDKVANGKITFNFIATEVQDRC